MRIVPVGAIPIRVIGDSFKPLAFGTTFQPLAMILSFSIAMVTSYMVFDLIERVSMRRQRPLWMLAASVIMGTGLWLVNYIGMQAFPTPMSEDTHSFLQWMTIFATILTCYATLRTVSSWLPKLMKLLIGGNLLSIGIAITHITQIIPTNMNAMVNIDILMSILTYFLTLGLSSMLIWFADLLHHEVPTAQKRWKFRSVLAIGLALGSIQYMAMSTIIVSVAQTTVQGPTYSAFFNLKILPLVVAITAMLLLGLIWARFIDYRFSKQISTARHLANHDFLTQLPNRRFLHNRLQELLRYSRQHSEAFGVLFLDIDRFKVINDSLGHAFGDRLLKEIAERLHGIVESNDLVARMGGDEFTILLANKPLAAVVECGQRILDSLARPFLLDGREFFVSASIGIAMFPSDGDDAETLMQRADAAMFHAKNHGNTLQEYSTIMNEQPSQSLEIETALHKALERNEFVLYYQPQIDIGSQQVYGAEALIRWSNPEMGMVSPAQFIPLAEETGLIVPIGEWVLRTACAQNKAWQNAGYPPMRIAINLSMIQFEDENLVQVVKSALEDTGLEPKYLELEITESIAMHNETYVLDKLHRLKELGLEISMDDFGTGYSSLAYLKKYPIDTLKIDQSFVRGIPENLDDSAIVSAIIALARSLQIHVIAEGVELQEQLGFLQHQKCDSAQGYLFSKPIAADEFALIFKNLAESAAGSAIEA